MARDEYVEVLRLEKFENSVRKICQQIRYQGLVHYLECQHFSQKGTLWLKQWSAFAVSFNTML